jgi:hypothetical protein
MNTLVDKIFNAVSSGGAWPAVVLLLSALALILATFIIVQRGRKNPIIKIFGIVKIELGLIATLDVSEQIEERPRQEKSAHQINQRPAHKTTRNNITA